MFVCACDRKFLAGKQKRNSSHPMAIISKMIMGKMDPMLNFLSNLTLRLHGNGWMGDHAPFLALVAVTGLIECWTEPEPHFFLSLRCIHQVSGVFNARYGMNLRHVGLCT